MELEYYFILVKIIFILGRINSALRKIRVGETGSYYKWKKKENLSTQVIKKKERGGRKPSMIWRASKQGSIHFLYVWGRGEVKDSKMTKMKEEGFVSKIRDMRRRCRFLKLNLIFNLLFFKTFLWWGILNKYQSKDNYVHDPLCNHHQLQLMPYLISSINPSPFPDRRFQRKISHIT